MSVQQHSVTVVDMTAGPCRRPSTAGETIGTPCPACGHTNLVHPGAQNPALASCVLCVLVEVTGGGSAA